MAIALTIGAGDLTLTFGDFSLGGIGTATFGAIIVYQLLRERPGTGETAVADGAVGERTR